MSRTCPAPTPRRTLQKAVLRGNQWVFGRTYDVSADGMRFLMIKQGSGTSATTAKVPTITVVQNRFQELKRLVPTK